MNRKMDQKMIELFTDSYYNTAEIWEISAEHVKY